MNYEIAYNEALERAMFFKEHLLELDEKDFAEEIDYIFPELLELENERIKKDIINYIQVANQIVPQFQKDKWVTWLMKQGKKS